MGRRCDIYRLGVPIDETIAKESSLMGNGIQCLKFVRAINHMHMSGVVTRILVCFYVDLLGPQITR
jgi:hypothetical protein